MARQRTKPNVKTRTSKTSPRAPHKSKAASSGPARSAAKSASRAAPKKTATKPAKGKPAAKPRTPVRSAAAKPSPKPAVKKTAAKPSPKGASAPPSMKAAPPPRKPATPAKRAKRVHFDAKTLASIKAGLLEQREELTVQLKDIEEQAFKTSQSEMSGEVGYDEDYADAGTATFERERDLSLANNVQDLLDKINKALGKIEEGSYGVCESCGDPISADRLKALPHVLLCINCKKREERR